MFRKIGSIAIGSLLLNLNAFAYGPIGHRVVAEIAQHHLSRHAKRELKKIIGNEDLSWGANWPDFIKSDTTGKWKSASAWHYVDVPGHLDRQAFMAALKALPGKNLYTQIPAMIADMKNKNLPIEQRKIAVYFLVHMLGDLHQPLHVGREEDQGGNKITVSWFGKSTNIHSVWDESLIDYQRYSYTEYANQLDRASKEEQAQMINSSLEDWFYESHSNSDTIYDLTPQGSKLSFAYNYRFVNILNHSLLEGGLRLAKILNENL